MMKEIFDNIIKCAKDVMVARGKHIPQAILEYGNGELAMIVLDFSDDEHKEISLRYLRDLIQKDNINRYFFITEGWMSCLNANKKMYRRASRDIDRKEVLLVSEYRRDLTSKTMACFFVRENDAVVFTEEKNMGDSQSVWNCYLELDGVLEGFGNVIKDVNDIFIKKQAKNISDKYKSEFFSCKSPEERIVVIRKMMLDMENIKKEQMRTILEDVDEEV